MPPSESAVTNDLFISYSHIDNQPWGAGRHQWVNELHKELTTRLAQLLGRQVRVWRDDKIRGNDELTERIISELSRSAAFACVISPRYLKSEWCIREFQEFSTRRKSTNPGARSIFKIVKTPVELAQQPLEVNDLIGYDFFYETASGKVHEFYPGYADNSEEGRQFWQKIDDLAQDIRLALGPDPTPDQPGSGKTVYLAETTGDVKLAREDIRRSLGQRGYRVVPDRSLPPAADELVPLINADLKQAYLTIHPVGARYGFIPEGHEQSIVELQIDAATANNGHGHHLIWVSPEAAPSEDKQKRFIERLRTEYTERAGTELLDQKPLEELKSRLVQKLEPPAKPPTRSVLKGLRVYLVCEGGQGEGVNAIARYLREQGLTVSPSLHEGDASELEKDHRDLLVRCDAMLVYFASGGPAWLRRKQRDVWDAPGWGRTKQMRAQAVVVAAPNTLEHAQGIEDEFILVDGGAGFRPEHLQPFVEQIRSSLGGP